MLLQRVDSFKGEFSFLSNMYECNVVFEGIRYGSAESAFQAQKTTNFVERLEFSNLTPRQARNRGRKLVLREDWDKVKEDIMYRIVKTKFTQNEDLKEKLLSTGTAYLEEGNTWGDDFWGTVRGEGYNKLGTILMRVRKELKEGK